MFSFSRRSTLGLPFGPEPIGFIKPPSALAPLSSAMLIEVESGRTRSRCWILASVLYGRGSCADPLPAFSNRAILSAMPSIPCARCGEIHPLIGEPIVDGRDKFARDVYRTMRWVMRKKRAEYFHQMNDLVFKLFKEGTTERTFIPWAGSSNTTKASRPIPLSFPAVPVLP